MMMIVVAYASNAAAIELEHGEHGWALTPNGRTAMNSAFGFASVAMAVRIARTLYYAATLPSFTVTFLATALEHALLLALVIPIAFTSSLAVATGLASAVLAYELIARVALTRLMFRFNGMQHRASLQLQQLTHSRPQYRQGVRSCHRTARAQDRPVLAPRW